MNRSIRRFLSINNPKEERRKLLWKQVLQLKQNDSKKDSFIAEHLFKGRKSEKYIYGGQVVAQALRAGSSTVPPQLRPHSMHSYFIKAGSVHEPVTYDVERMRDGKSFATRGVRAYQSGELLFSCQQSFHVEEHSHLTHQEKFNLPHGPDGLQNARTLLKKQIEADAKDIHMAANQFMKYKYAEFPDTFHGIFETRPLNQNIYVMKDHGELQEPSFHLWIRPSMKIGETGTTNEEVAAYISDSSMIESALMPHVAKGQVLSMAFSLDHCMWFHTNDFSLDDWTYWDQKSEVAGGGRTHTRTRMFTSDGRLIMTVIQEGLVRVSKMK